MAKTLIVLSVDPEFRDLCPPLDEEEKSLLRESMIEEGGCHDPIIYWNAPGNPILDGHHRKEICDGEGFAFPSKGIDLPDREAAIRWVYRHQLGKRNLSETCKHVLRGRYYNSLKADRGENLKNTKTPANPRTDKNVRSGNHGDFVTSGNHAEEIAEAEGVSEKTVRRDGKLAEDISTIKAKAPEVARAIEAGDIPAKAASSLAAAPKSELRKVENAAGKKERKAAAKAVVEKQSAPAESEPVKDSQGTVIPEQFREVFTRGRDAFKTALNLEKQLMAAMRAIAADPIIGVYFAGKAVDKDSAEHLNQIRRNLRFAAPHGVCPYCKGKGTDAKGKCRPCYGLGWVTEGIHKSGREAMDR